MKPYREALLEFEQQYLTSVLAESNGNVSEAARRAGVFRTHFYKMCERAGIELRPLKAIDKDVVPHRVIREAPDEGNAEWKALGEQHAMG